MPPDDVSHTCSNVLAVQSPSPEGVDLGVELLADPAHLVFGDAVDAQRLGEVVDRPGC